MSSQTRRRIVCGISLGLFFLTMILLTVLFFDKLTALASDPETLREEIAARGLGGKLFFVFLMAAQVVLAIIPGHPFELAGGVCFGVLEGTVLTLIGAAVGSACNFALARVLGVRVITAFYSDEKLQKVSFLKENKRQNLLTFIAFLIPGIPKDMLAYFMGITRMRFCWFLLLSTAGRLPGILLAVLGGAAAGERDPMLLLVFGLVFAVLFILSLLLYRVQSRAAKAESAPERSPEPDEK